MGNNSAGTIHQLLRSGALVLAVLALLAFEGAALAAQ